MSYIKTDSLRGIKLAVYGREARVHTFTCDMLPFSGDMDVTVKGILAQDALQEPSVVTNTPRAGESAEQSHARTAEARAEYRAQHELIDFAKTGAPPALAAEGNVSDIDYADCGAPPVAPLIQQWETNRFHVAAGGKTHTTPARVLPRMEEQPPWVGDGIAQNDRAWVDSSPTYSAVLTARDEKHPTRPPHTHHLEGIDVKGCPASLNAFAKEVHADNRHWWHDPATGAKLDRNMGEMLMLVVSEIAECMEGERKDLMDTHLPHRKMAEVELADAVIRLGDIVGSLGGAIPLVFSDRVASIAVYEDEVPENKGEALKRICDPLHGISASAGRDRPGAVAYKVARTFVRIERYAAKHGYDLWGAVAEKREYNRHRADHKPAARLAANGKKF